MLTPTYSLEPIFKLVKICNIATVKRNDNELIMYTCMNIQIHLLWFGTSTAVYRDTGPTKSTPTKADTGNLKALINHHTLRS